MIVSYTEVGGVEQHSFYFEAVTRLTVVKLQRHNESDKDNKLILSYLHGSAIAYSRVVAPVSAWDGIGS